MQARRPTTVMVLGILNIVFGSLSLGCCGLFGLLTLMEDSRREWWGRLKAQVPAVEAVAVGEIVAQSLLAVLLVVAGTGLLRMAGWARVLSIGYAVVTFVLETAVLLYELIVVNPLKRQMMKFRFTDDWVSLMKALPLMTYAVVLLVMMLLPHVSGAFRGAPYGGWHPDDEPGRWDDDEDEPWWREERGR
jgi:hypothetical protein